MYSIRLCALHVLGLEDCGNVQVPPMSIEMTRRVLETNLPLPLDRIFERIDLEHCLGSATISQVLQCLISFYSYGMHERQVASSL